MRHRLRNFNKNKFKIIERFKDAKSILIRNNSKCEKEMFTFLKYFENIEILTIFDEYDIDEKFRDYFNNMTCEMINNNKYTLSDISFSYYNYCYHLTREATPIKMEGGVSQLIATDVLHFPNITKVYVRGGNIIGNSKGVLNDHDDDNNKCINYCKDTKLKDVAFFNCDIDKYVLDEIGSYFGNSIERLMMNNVFMRISNDTDGKNLQDMKQDITCLEEILSKFLKLERLECVEKNDNEMEVITLATRESDGKIKTCNVLRLLWLLMVNYNNYHHNNNNNNNNKPLTVLKSILPNLKKLVSGWTFTEGRDRYGHCCMFKQGDKDHKLIVDMNNNVNDLCYYPILLLNRATYMLTQRMGSTFYYKPILSQPLSTYCLNEIRHMEIWNSNIQSSFWLKTLNNTNNIERLVLQNARLEDNGVFANYNLLPIENCSMNKIVSKLNKLKHLHCAKISNFSALFAYNLLSINNNGSDDIDGFNPGYLSKLETLILQIPPKFDASYRNYNNDNNNNNNNSNNNFYLLKNLKNVDLFFDKNHGSQDSDCLNIIGNFLSQHKNIECLKLRNTFNINLHNILNMINSVDHNFVNLKILSIDSTLTIKNDFVQLIESLKLLTDFVHKRQHLIELFDFASTFVIDNNNKNNNDSVELFDNSYVKEIVLVLSQWYKMCNINFTFLIVARMLKKYDEYSNWCKHFVEVLE